MTGTDAVIKGLIVWIMVAAILLPAGNGYSLSGSICGKDLDGNGSITNNEFQQCISIGSDHLCPIDLADCQMNGNVPVCPYGASYPCHLNGSKYQCSDVTCANTITTQADTSSYQGNGQRDPNSGQCLGQIYIFNGKGGTCKEPGFDTNFFQCCTMDPGSFIFVEAACGTNDRLTSEAMYARRTHYVGSYCVDEWPLIGCVQTAQTHCIFQSKLGRIIQEQGRKQLKAFQDANGNPYWGSPESPNCRGFTPEEFQSLDFSKMDLSEYFADITTKANAAIQQDMRNNVQNYYYNLP
jgi:conjugal transfer mating pair stabilization protein TraN